MGIGQHSRTAGHTAVGRDWSPSHGIRVVAARDGRAITALRVTTYLLASLTCLVILAGAVYAAFLLDRFSATSNGFAHITP